VRLGILPGIPCDPLAPSGPVIPGNPLEPEAPAVWNTNGTYRTQV